MNASSQVIHGAIASLLALGAALPALAGPNTPIPTSQRAPAPSKQFAATIASKDCDALRLALPVDHGPRAQTTPKLNQQRKERFEARIKACKDAAG